MEQDNGSVLRPGTVVPAVSAAAPSSRSRLIAGVLGIFLGAFGIHRFYLGYTTIGIIQLVLTLMSFGFVGLWGVVEGILILAGVISKDVHGRTLEFDGDMVAGESNPGVREPRSRLVAAILAFFLGVWGIHRFYLGYTKIGLLQLSMTLAGLAITVICEIVVAWRLISLVFYSQTAVSLYQNHAVHNMSAPIFGRVISTVAIALIPLVIPAIVWAWAFVEGILIAFGAFKTDANGNALNLA